MARKLLAMLLLLSAMLASIAGCAAMGGGDGKVDATLDVVDEGGHAVPYATVWGYLLPRAPDAALGAVPINAEDLWRLTTRYEPSFEFATPFNKPVSYLIVYPMGDGNGKVDANIDYKFREGSAAKIPDKMFIGFTVMKRGYLPARVDFTVTNERAVSSKVVLKRDPQSPVESQPYLVAYERLRYEFSDTSRNENISGSNDQRIERLRKEMEAAAQQAVDAGDKKAAARIYTRMQYLPMILFFNGKPAGFRQSAASYPQGEAYLAQAYALDPANPYIAAGVLFHEGAERFGAKYYRERATEEERRAFAEYLGRLKALMQASGPQLWPAYHHLYALWLIRSSDPKDRDSVKPLLEELYRYEPTYKIRDGLMSGVSEAEKRQQAR